MNAHAITVLADALARFSTPAEQIPVRDLLEVFGSAGARDDFIRDLGVELWRRSDGRLRVTLARIDEFPNPGRDLNVLPLRLTGVRRVLIHPAVPAISYRD